MDSEPNPRAVSGGNYPPPYDMSVLAAHAAKVAEWSDAAGAWLDLGKLETKEQAGKVGDLINGARAIHKAIDTARTDAKAPHVAAADAVQKAYKLPLDAIEKTISRLKPLVTDFMQREEARLKAEAKAKAAAEALEKAERERMAAIERHDVMGEAAAEEAALAAEEAAEEAAAAPVKARVESYSGGGRTMAMRTVKEIAVSNWNLAYAAVREDPAVKEAIEKAVLRKIRAKDWPDNGTVPGVTISTRKVAA